MLNRGVLVMLAMLAILALFLVKELNELERLRATYKQGLNIGPLLGAITYD